MSTEREWLEGLRPEDQDDYFEPVGHLYLHPPGPGSRALCGALWTPDEAERWERGEVAVCCVCQELRP